MSAPLTIRDVRAGDFGAWLQLWDDYNASAERVVSAETTTTTWVRFLDPAEPINALAAEAGDGRLVGFVHYLYHRDTVAMGLVCYLADLFTAPSMRGQGGGRALVEAVYTRAKAAGSPSVYWLTHESNDVARRLYDKMATNFGFIAYQKDL